MRSAMPRERALLQNDDVQHPARWRRVLNDILLGVYLRLEGLEAAPGLYVLPRLEFETVAAGVAPTNTPFNESSGGLKAACPFTPAGVVLLSLEALNPSGVISSSAHDIKWRAYPTDGGTGATIRIMHIAGLAVSTRYAVRLGALRG